MSVCYRQCFALPEVSIWSISCDCKQCQKHSQALSVPKDADSSISWLGDDATWLLSGIAYIPLRALLGSSRAGVQSWAREVWDNLASVDPATLEEAAWAMLQNEPGVSALLCGRAAQASLSPSLEGVRNQRRYHGKTSHSSLSPPPTREGWKDVPQVLTALQSQYSP